VTPDLSYYTENTGLRVSWSRLIRGTFGLKRREVIGDRNYIRGTSQFVHSTITVTKGLVTVINLEIRNVVHLLSLSELWVLVQDGGI
jgi:hypothetical protein